MPATIQVPGPTIIQIATATTFVDLGYSDNDTLPTIQITDHQHDVKTVLSGDVPEEVVLRGIEARIAVALVKWDETNLAAMLNDMRGGASPGISVVGRRIVSAGASFQLKIASVGGTQSYLFPVSFLQADGHGDSQWGNRERVLTLNFRAIPNASGSLYTYTA